MHVISKNNTVKLEFEDFSLNGPVSTQFTNYFAISLKNSCVRRKHRIKILKTICTRYCNYLVHMVFRFPICNTGPVKNFSKQNPKKNTDKSPIISGSDSMYEWACTRNPSRKLLLSGSSCAMREAFHNLPHRWLTYLQQSDR